jgi:GTPase involved in cell partitioning and DNA repair
VLLYVLDGSAFDASRTPAQDLKALLNELELYSKKLMKKPSLVFINKTDVKGAFMMNYCSTFTIIWKK